MVKTMVKPSYNLNFNNCLEMIKFYLKIVTWNRNALSLDMMTELVTNLRRNKQNENLRCIVLSANGSVFSAGHNLKEFSIDKGPHLHRQVFEKASELMLEIIGSPVPVIAKVNGLSAAAGCQLVSCCDLIVSTKDSTFSTPG